ncbi:MULTISPECIES: hypothetical protein [Streptomyces]|uniref:hypothetical protein n=1 Tax=Streptomyces TaxID=1883 RepID=UPI001CBCD43A|nr:hypothetical protein [Streptomyces purpurogeneiscleroticus]
MLPSVSTLQQIGLAVLLLATLAWAIGLVRTVRRDRRAPQPPGAGAAPRLLKAVPRQVVPPSESVELTAAEREAFAGLVRELTRGH